MVGNDNSFTPGVPMPGPEPVIPSTIANGFVGGAVESLEPATPLQPPSATSVNSYETGISQGNAGLSSTQFLVMYVIGFFLVASILSSVVTLVNLFFDNFNNSDVGGYNDYISGFKLYLMLWSISNLLVVTPVFVFLVLKIRKFEPSDLTAMGSKIKNFSYGVFMIILGLSTLSAVVATVYQATLKFAPKGDDVLQTSQAWWTGFVSALVTAIIFAGVFAYYLKANRKRVS